MEFEKKALSTKQKSRLIEWIQKQESLVGHDPHFDKKEPLDDTHSLGGCDDPVVVRTQSKGCSVFEALMRLARMVGSFLLAVQVLLGQSVVALADR